MEHGSEQLEDLAFSEVVRTTKKIAHEVESDNADPDRTAEEALREMEHMTKQAIKIAEIVAGAVPKGWGSGSVERSQEWDVKF